MRLVGFHRSFFVGMPNYNNAMIIGYGRDKYGLNLSDQDASNIMDKSGGGDPGRLDAVFQALPQIQERRMFETAQKAQQMQVEANKPAVARLESHKTNLDTKYDELLTSIKGSEQYSQDQGNVEARQALAARGINPEDELGAKIVGDKLRPISTQFGQLYANTGLQRERDQTSIEEQIASLLAGNVPQSLNFANSTMGLMQQAQQIANNLELGREGNRLQERQINLAEKGGGNENRYMTLGEGQTIFDLLNNIPLYTNPKTYAPKTGSSSSGW